MKYRVSAYWLCQLGGWSSYILVYTFFYFTIRTKPSPDFFPTLFIDAVGGLCITHLMRIFIKKYNFLNHDIRKQIIFMAVTTLVFSLLYGTIVVKVDELLNYESDMWKQYTFWNKVMRASISYFLILSIWNLIYFTYHYVMRTRTDKLDKIRLESLVKELELKTIKSHINPHFIFNALNSIRALVDENPERARTAITELSNILRSSMQAEKLETATLERELSLVKDYLELEHIRFEDRLNVEYDIDEDTLDQQVPPMMLQTLVENAIKHGISKQVSGGKIKIISDFRGDHHELIVQNTGKLAVETNSEGFGIVSTQNRLKLLYGGKAAFALQNVNGNMVEAKVIIPVLNS
ncbi:sensor histidine kinase [Panacibacter ginsenosidivorans]|uniref:Sensor histidine kinase n=1 Tax=Panacibacter ginsenosidivorans TaxID=1813871 RepID=A0A5B8V933_9BACT|nr:histidine kinase [Panacibacter ginsenosidivorans]QEC67226.1 sensor histidine kinase [Panacibacter ginsenosidivorans]